MTEPLSLETIVGEFNEGAKAWIFKDAVFGLGMQLDLAVVYASTNELDLAFETLSPLTKTPNGLFYGELERNPYWNPLRKDPRFDKLLAELAPCD